MNRKDGFIIPPKYSLGKSFTSPFWIGRALSEFENSTWETVLNHRQHVGTNFIRASQEIQSLIVSVVLPHSA